MLSPHSPRSAPPHPPKAAQPGPVSLSDRSDDPKCRITKQNSSQPPGETIALLPKPYKQRHKPPWHAYRSMRSDQKDLWPRHPSALREAPSHDGYRWLSLNRKGELNV